MATNLAPADSPLTASAPLAASSQIARVTPAIRVPTSGSVRADMTGRRVESSVETSALLGLGVATDVPAHLVGAGLRSEHGRYKIRHTYLRHILS